MSEPGPSRVLNISNLEGNDNQQQYVEVGSNMFLGTKDGIKYTLVESSDGKFRLVEVMSDSSTSLNSPKSYPTPVRNENCTQVHDAWVEPKILKLMPVKTEQSPCKGQGDEIGNSVISPTLSISDFKELENPTEKVIFDGTPANQDNSSQLTYTTLLPVQPQKETWNAPLYYTTPRSSQYSYSATFPTPGEIRSPRFSRRGRMHLRTSTAPFSPIPKVRMRAPRQRRPRRSTYHYNPRILHSTPNNLSRLAYNSPTSLSDNSSGSQNTSNFNNTSQSSIEYPRVPNNTPDMPEDDSVADQKMFSIQWVPHIATGMENYVALDPRTTHNEKERKRRLRIKNACQTMRRLLPYVLEKIDNASVFEQAVHFISFMRETVGAEYDREFMQKNYIF